MMQGRSTWLPAFDLTSSRMAPERKMMEKGRYYSIGFISDSE